MGVDWIPCRLDAGVSREEIEQLIRLEALQFRARGGWLPHPLVPLVCLSDAECANVIRQYEESGRLGDRLLFKNESHRVYAVTYNELFPLEWRLEAYRTIAPEELPGQVTCWQNYREELAQGGHRAYLLQLLLYLGWYELGNFLREVLVPTANASRTCTASWAARPEVISVREEILAFPGADPPSPPSWKTLAGQALRAAPEKDPEFRALRVAYEQVGELTRSCNAAVRRGNWQHNAPEFASDLEDWIRRHLADTWFASFLTWVKPWVHSGYGLYRDCE